MAIQYTLRNDKYGKGLLQLRLNISKENTSFLVLLFEDGKGTNDFQELTKDYFEADRIFTGLLNALKLGRGISLKEEEVEEPKE